MEEEDSPQAAIWRAALSRKHSAKKSWQSGLESYDPGILMNPSTKSGNKLATYLTVGLGAGCLAGQSDAAVIVTFYGPGAQNSGTTPATPAGLNVSNSNAPGHRNISDLTTAAVAFNYGDGITSIYFTSGADLNTSKTISAGYGTYKQGGSAYYGAVLNSSNNYANISFDGHTFLSTVYEAVGQFYLDGNGGGYLIATARNSDNSALSISAGKAAIDAVPEPSAMALLALGAGGLLARRRRTAA
jgi:hypothetical protein